VLGGLALSFYLGVASGITAAVYILRRAIRSNRTQATFRSECGHHEVSSMRQVELLLPICCEFLRLVV
jgi:hypothetical protein